MFKHTERKKRGGFLPFVIFRLLLSLIILSILGLGVYQAFRYFSGVDPIKIDPKTAITSLLSSDDVIKTASEILGFDLSGLGVSLPGVLDKNSKQPVEEATPPASKPEETKSSVKLIFKFALIGDSHNDNETLKKALKQAKEAGAKLVIGMGDYSDTGTLAELQAAREIFLASGLPFYLMAGDHDLWDSRDKGLASSSNFSKVFGATYQAFTDSSIMFVLIFNSDNYEGVDAVQMDWLEDALSKEGKNKPKQTFVFVHEPLYHPSAERVMGKITPALKKQAEELIAQFKKVGVAEIFAGDVHSYARFEEPKSGLKMTSVGAVTSLRNLQLPRFIMVDVFEDGGYNIADTEIK